MPEAYLEELSGAANELELGVPKCIDEIPPPPPDTDEDDEDDDDDGKKRKRGREGQARRETTSGGRQTDPDEPHGERHGGTT